MSDPGGAEWERIVAALEADGDDWRPTTALPGSFVGVLLDIGLEPGDAPLVRAAFTDPEAAAMAFDDERRRLEIPADDVHVAEDEDPWQEFVRAGGSMVWQAAAYREARSGRRRALLLAWSRLDP